MSQHISHSSHRIPIIAPWPLGQHNCRLLSMLSGGFPLATRGVFFDDPADMIPVLKGMVEERCSELGDHIELLSFGPLASIEGGDDMMYPKLHTMVQANVGNAIGVLYMLTHTKIMKLKRHETKCHKTRLLKKKCVDTERDKISEMTHHELKRHET
eukprot:GHVR01136652.1.p1 GENE.GHVR01136652.1~~GHVR01136652.1.p1  ORF type:complete len:156 (+),score=23.69 GHVR01136652.1:816-1283(+)